MKLVIVFSCTLFIACIVRSDSFNSKKWNVLSNLKANQRKFQNIIISTIAAYNLIFNLNVENAIADSRLNAPTAAGTRVNSGV